MLIKSAQMSRQLTPRQVQLLRIIARMQARHCYSPTIGELAAELGISRSTTFEHIGELRAKGLLSALPGRARSLKLTSRGQSLLKGLAEGPGVSATGIPLVGRVAAGEPIEAVEDRDCLSLALCFGAGDDIFALEVRGESMVGEDIRDGDYVICRRRTVADDGALVVAIVGNENATLKRFYKEKSRARLEPANDDFDPIYCDNCRIEGVVVGLVRKL